MFPIAHDNARNCEPVGPDISAFRVALLNMSSKIHIQGRTRLQVNTPRPCILNPKPFLLYKAAMQLQPG
eukprot:1157362-Pelagomonas_calceolata.AAC.16